MLSSDEIKKEPDVNYEELIKTEVASENGNEIDSIKDDPETSCGEVVKTNSIYGDWSETFDMKESKLKYEETGMRECKTENGNTMYVVGKGMNFNCEEIVHGTIVKTEGQWEDGNETLGDPTSQTCKTNDINSGKTERKIIEGLRKFARLRAPICRHHDEASASMNQPNDKGSSKEMLNIQEKPSDKIMQKPEEDERRTLAELRSCAKFFQKTLINQSSTHSEQTFEEERKSIVYLRSFARTYEETNTNKKRRRYSNLEFTNWHLTEGGFKYRGDKPQNDQADKNGAPDNNDLNYDLQEKIFEKRLLETDASWKCVYCSTTITSFSKCHVLSGQRNDSFDQHFGAQFREKRRNWNDGTKRQRCEKNDCLIVLCRRHLELTETNEWVPVIDKNFHYSVDELLDHAYAKFVR